MSDSVNPRRTYDARGRQEQARRNRLAVLEAARRLFLEHGYAATTMGAVAGAAGVSVETVYKAFGNKPGLAKAVFDVSIVGDDDPVPLVEREKVARMRGELDPRRMLRLYGEHLAETAPRAAPVQLLIKAAAASDPGAAAVWEQLQTERLAGMTMLATELHARGALRPDLPVADARDILWTCNAAEIYELLVVGRGWTPERYGSWVADALIGALLPA